MPTGVHVLSIDVDVLYSSAYIPVQKMGMKNGYVARFMKGVQLDGLRLPTFGDLAFAQRTVPSPCQLEPSEVGDEGVVRFNVRYPCVIPPLRL